MEKAKVYYSDLRTSPTSNLLDKMERLLTVTLYIADAVRMQ